MFVKNNFVLRAYINGSLGEVIGFEEDDKQGILPKVKLTDGTTLLQRARNMVNWKWSRQGDCKLSANSFTFGIR